MRVRIAIAALTLTFLPVLFPQAKRDPAGDWPMWAHDLKGTKFSALKQITPQNVGKMKQAWSYRFNRDGKPVINGPSGSELYQEITPIVVNGIMYTPAGDRVVAIQPEDGKELWSFEMPEGLASFRGVGYWPGDKNNPPRIIFTGLKKMYGLNAKTGRIDPGFGKEGTVNLDVTYAGTPTIVGNLLFLGTNFYGPGMPHIGPQLDERGGQIPVQHGYDVRTGKELWEFHTFPRPGEVGYDTWPLKGSAENRTGNNVWAFALTVDEKNGLLYFPVSGPGANYYGGGPAGREFVRQLRRGGGHEDGQVQVALPDGASRVVGLQLAAFAELDRYSERRQDDSGAGVGGQDGLYVHLEPPDGRTDLSDSGSAGDQVAGAEGGQLPHTADSDQAAGNRSGSDDEG